MKVIPGPRALRDQRQALRAAIDRDARLTPRERTAANAAIAPTQLAVFKKLLGF